MATARCEAADHEEDRPLVFLKLCPVAGKGDVEQGVLQVVDDKSVSIFRADKDEPTTCELDGVLNESALPNTVYETVTADLAERFVGGRDCTLMAYGSLQTGKTYNLFGNICGDSAAMETPIPPSSLSSSGDAKIVKNVNADTAKKEEDDSDSGDSDSDSEKSEKPEKKAPQHAPTAATSDDFDDFGLDDLIAGALEGIPVGDQDAEEEEEEEEKDEQATKKSEGITIPLCRKIFHTLESEASEILSLTIKVSVVEIYLDRITDLLLPQVDDNDVFLKENPRGGATVIQGCAALSCVQPSDVLDAIRRALQLRTRSQAEPFRDSHRSTVVVQMRLEQERTRQVNRSSILQIVDLCASELSCINSSSSEATKDLDQKIAASILDLQKEVQEPSPFSSTGDRPTLSRLLLPFCRAETVSRVLLTASKLNVATCQRTLDFGLACRQLPAVRLPPRETVISDSPSSEEAIAREKRLTELVFALAHECQRVAKIAKTPKHGPVWTAISEIQRLPHQNRPLNFSVETKREHEINAEKFAIRAELREVERKASTHKHLMKQFESEIHVLKAQNEQLKHELQHGSGQLDKAKHQKLTLEQRVKEVEHNLRTSQFRESEAVVFLRQFRKFYYRLMRQIHGEDSSPGGSLVKQIAGAPDAIQLIDLDQSMVESGLMEEDEIGNDIPISKTYLPSRQALVRSVIAAETAANAAASGESGKNGDSRSNGGENDVFELSDKIKTTSIVKRHETGEATEARQRIYKTPAGRYLALQEKRLEAELLAMSEKFVKMQCELEEERATRNDLESTSAAVNKAKHAKELRTLKDQLNKRANDLKAVIFKMNEIHTVSKALQEKVADREQHVDYLEEEIGAMRKKESALLATKEEAEERLKQVITDLEKKIKSSVVPMWQLGEPGTTPPSITSRISLSFAIHGRKGGENGSGPERRLSIGEEEDDWLHNIYRDLGDRRGSSGEGDASVPNEDIETLKKELKKVKAQLQKTLSRPTSSGKRFTPRTFPAVQAPRAESFCVGQTSGPDETSPPDATALDGSFGVDYGYEYEEDEPSEAVEGSESMNHSVSGLLFMDDDMAPTSTAAGDPGTGNPKRPRRPSVYGGLVDAYNMQSETPVLENASASHKADEEHAGHRRTSSLQGHVTRWQPPKPTSQADDDDNETPEWMRKFKKIAARNHAESVIETSGGAEARELTRTFVAEIKPSHNFDTQTWKDEEDRKNPENKDSNPADREKQSSPMSSPRSPAHSIARSHSPIPSNVSPPSKSNSSSPETDSTESESFDPNRLKNMFAAKAANSKPLAPSGSQFNPSYTSGVKKWTPKKKKDDDSDSDDSFAKEFLSAASSHIVDQPVVDHPAEEHDSSTGSESDVEEKEASDHGFDDDKPVKKAPAQIPTLVPAVDKEKKSFLEDSDSEDDSDEGKPVKVVPSSPQPPAASPAPAPAPTKKKSFLEDSDSEDDSYDGKQAQETPGPAPAPPLAPSLPAPVKKKPFPEDSDSEDDSYDGKQAQETPAPAPAPPLAPSQPAPVKKKSFLEDSDSEGDSDDDKPAPAPIPPPAPSPAAAPVKKKSFLEDSDSEGDSDDDKPVKASPALASAKKLFVDDDSSNGSDSDDNKKSPAQAPAPAPSAQKKSFLDDSDTEADSDDDGKNDWAAPLKPISALTPSTTKQKSFLDGSESESASVDEKSAKEVRAAAAAPVKKSFLQDSDYESETEVEPSLGTSKAYGMRDDSDSESVHDIGAKYAQDSGPEEEETERAGSGHIRNSGSNGDIGNRASPIGGSPVAPKGKSFLVDSTHDSDEESAHKEAMRNVPDFGGEVHSGIPTNDESSKKEKFVIKNGKLVKDSGHGKKGGEKGKKMKFAIKGGKLVQTEDEGAKAAEAKHEPKALTAMVPGARAPAKKGAKSSNFVIKGGKLVKNEEKVKQPAFSIMGGKLVKGSDVKKGRKKPKKKDGLS
eukprot:scaffold7174_cov143-Amphora_coffeaeformis.AAC.2